ncbi:hypothetical protein YC2023_000048 [Brassica napus]
MDVQPKSKQFVKAHVATACDACQHVRRISFKTHQIMGPIWEKIVLSWAASLEKTQLKNNLSEMDRGRRDRIDRSGMFDPPA